jgi:lipopolysaccharide/colanic/teichoic acid biosynthesis glycosyltransferase
VSDGKPEPALDAQQKNRLVYRFIKRTADIFFSAIGLILLSPVYLVTAVCIKLDSRGPAIFVQNRAGLNGKPFNVYKFRTMSLDADEQRRSSEVIKNGTGPIKAEKDDIRVTKLGRFLRATTIDELPQLVNVLRADMSIVGPRPFAMYEHERLNDYQKQRTLVKPGLTCYWQVHGRHLVDSDTRIEMDLKYICTQGFLTDFILVLKTFPALITRRGAF